jgi:hypothetical protein
MLAANLADPLVVSDHQSIHLLPPVPLEDDAGAAIGEELYLVSQADVPSKDSKVNDEGRNKDRSVNMDLEGDDEDFILNDEEEQVPTFFYLINASFFDSAGVNMWAYTLLS